MVNRRNKQAIHNIFLHETSHFYRFMKNSSYTVHNAIIHTVSGPLRRAQASVKRLLPSGFYNIHAYRVFQPSTSSQSVSKQLLCSITCSSKPSKLDLDVMRALDGVQPDPVKFPNLHHWLKNVKSYSEQQQKWCVNIAWSL